MKQFKYSVLGGTCITLGTFAYLITLQKTNNIFLASMAFYLGLSLILLLQINLFTGQVYSKYYLDKFDYIKSLFFTWWGNLIGCIITSVVLLQIIQVDVTTIMEHKLSLNIIQAIVSGCFCNMLVCAAVKNYNNFKNHLISGFFITFFVFMGFEHSIADMSYLTIAIYNGMNITLNQIITLLLQVTIGNIIGGLIIITSEK